MESMTLMDAPGPDGRWAHVGPCVIAVVLALALLAPSVAANGDDDEFEADEGWEVHAAIMAIAGILFVFAPTITVLKLFDGKTRARVHMAIGALAGAVVAGGIVLGWWMVEGAGRSHLHMTHSVVGYTTLALVIAPLASGYALTRTKGERRRTVLVAHVILAIVGLVAMLIAGATGAELE